MLRDARADIRVDCGRFSVPIEIKKDCHRDLWKALRSQLVTKYTTAPASDGYGIYLVLWFADRNRPVTRHPDRSKPVTRHPGGIRPVVRHPDGTRPRTPEELKRRLQQRLRQDLTHEKARKISVVVMDVTKPGR